MTDHLLDRLTFSEELLALGQFADHLLGRVAPSLHGRAVLLPHHGDLDSHNGWISSRGPGHNVSAVVRASITVTPGILTIAASILSGSVSTTGGYVSAFIPPWNPKRLISPFRSGVPSEHQAGGDFTITRPEQPRSGRELKGGSVRSIRHVADGSRKLVTNTSASATSLSRFSRPRGVLRSNPMLRFE